MAYYRSAVARSGTLAALHAGIRREMLASSLSLGRNPVREGDCSLIRSFVPVGQFHRAHSQAIRIQQNAIVSVGLVVCLPKRPDGWRGTTNRPFNRLMMRLVSKEACALKFRSGSLYLRLLLISCLSKGRPRHIARTSSAPKSRKPQMSRPRAESLCARARYWAEPLAGDLANLRRAIIQASQMASSGWKQSNPLARGVHSRVALCVVMQSVAESFGWPKLAPREVCERVDFVDWIGEGYFWRATCELQQVLWPNSRDLLLGEDLSQRASSITVVSPARGRWFSLEAT